MEKVQKLKRGDLKEALIDYAMDAALDGHVETMSLRKAARDLGVSSGAVYRHFPDKDSLLAEVAHLGFLELREIFLAIRPEGSPATDVKTAIERTHALVKAYISFAIAKPALWHMMFGRIGVLCRERMMKDSEHMRYTPLDATGENLNDLYELGALDRKPNISDVRYIWSAVHGAADLAQSGARMDSDQLDAVINDTVVRNLRAVRYKDEVD
ncbi:TetR family transcriptional regulator [Amylibacter ulvae]|uniref:TetR family transcriptional regulator n=1 Tax=Paramylibacter ulvae TaxID=1651968 RepID=A0ABQ3D402_9RHOB|nr:TetR/AcrR family transcriptional regulator [Amylibacter ulvae]GHA57604.1 TetR family transcriptional regulator [Amylibacter ulvae]